MVWNIIICRMISLVFFILLLGSWDERGSHLHHGGGLPQQAPAPYFCVALEPAEWSLSFVLNRWTHLDPGRVTKHVARVRKSSQENMREKVGANLIGVSFSSSLPFFLVHADHSLPSLLSSQSLPISPLPPSTPPLFIFRKGRPPMNSHKTCHIKLH